MLHVPAAPDRSWRASALSAGLPARAAGPRCSAQPEARALLAGVAAHAFRPFGAADVLRGRRRRSPPPRTASAGRSPRAARGAITRRDGVAARAARRDVRDRASTSTPRELAHADIVLLDTAPGAPPRISAATGCRAASRARYGASATARAPSRSSSRSRAACPWAYEPSRRAGTVHVGGTFEEIAAAEREVAPRPDARAPVRPRLPAVPRRPDPLRRRRAPGLRLRPRARRLRRRRDRGDRARRSSASRPASATASWRPLRPERRRLAAHNPNYVGGDIVTGANDPLQMVFRPRPALDPYAHRAPGVYLCSAATPPGAGAHGMCGYNAARSALRRL